MLVEGTNEDHDDTCVVAAVVNIKQKRCMIFIVVELLYAWLRASVS